MLMVFLVGAKPLSVMICRHLYSCLSTSIFTGQTVLQEPHKVEGENRQSARKSIVAAREIAKGETFSAENLVVKRPGTGRSPMMYWSMLGMKAMNQYRTDELI